MDRRERAARRKREEGYVSTRLARGFVGVVSGSAAAMSFATGGTVEETVLLAGFGLILGVVTLLALGIRPW